MQLSKCSFFYLKPKDPVLRKGYIRSPSGIYTWREREQWKKTREPPGKGDGKRERVKKQRGQLQRGCVCVSHQLDSYITTPPYYVYNPVTHLFAPSSCYHAVCVLVISLVFYCYWSLWYHVLLSSLYSLWRGLFFMKGGSCDHLWWKVVFCPTRTKKLSFGQVRQNYKHILCNLW